MSRSSADEVTMTTGIVFVRASDLSRPSTSMPSILGNFRSSRISFGKPLVRALYSPVQKTKSSASAPSFNQIRLLARLFFLRARMVSSASVLLSSTSRISTCCISDNLFSRFLFRMRQRKEKFRTHVKLSFSPHATAVTAYKPMNNRQSYAGPRKFVGAVQALEHAEEFIVILHFETDPVVLY